MVVNTASQCVDTPHENSLGMREIRGRIAGSSAAVMLGGSQDAHLGPRLSKVGLVELAGLTTPEQGSCWEGYCLVHAFPSGTHSVASRKGLGAMLHPFPQSGPASSVTIKLKTQSRLVFPAHRHTSTGVTYQPVLCKHNMIDLIIEGCLQGLEQAQNQSGGGEEDVGSGCCLLMHLCHEAIGTAVHEPGACFSVHKLYHRMSWPTCVLAGMEHVCARSL